MDMKTCARPYATAAFLHANSKDRIEQWGQLLNMASDIVKDDSVKAMLSSPALSSQAQLEKLLHILDGFVDKSCRNFLSIVCENKRLLLLPWINDHFFYLRSINKGEQEVTISSPYSIDHQQEEMLKKKLSHRLKKDINIKLVVDQSLLGGIKICAGDLIIDDTLKARLDKLANTLIA